jgi:hypothetical protein
LSRLNRFGAASIAAAVLLVATSAATYRPAVDGDAAAFYGALGIGSLGAFGAVLLAARRQVRSLISLGLVLAVLSPSVALHAIRFLRSGDAIGVTVDRPVAFQQFFRPTLGDGATLNVGGDGLELRVPAGKNGYLAAQPQVLSETGAWHQTLPRALWDTSHPELVTQEFRFRAQVVRFGAYFVVAELDRLTVQAVAGGVLVTAPSSPGEAVVAKFVPLSTDLTSWHEWSLRRSRGALTVTVAGQMVWSGPYSDGFERFRLGETRTGVDHGGVLRLRSASVRRSVSSMS